MRSSTIPKSIIKWIEANPEKVDSYHMEDDYCFDTPWSIWLYLKAPYTSLESGIGTIHEGTVKDFLNAVKYVGIESEENANG